MAIYQGRNYLIDSLQFSFQEDCLISTDFDSLRIWDASQDGLSLISSNNNNRFETLVYAPSGKYIAASVFGNETGIHLFDRKNRSHLAIFIGCTCCAKSLSFSTDNSLLASYLGRIQAQQRVQILLHHHLPSLTILHQEHPHQDAALCEMDNPFCVYAW